MLWQAFYPGIVWVCSIGLSLISLYTGFEIPCQVKRYNEAHRKEGYFSLTGNKGINLGYSRQLETIIDKK